jgi:hypothetical protein
MSFTESLPKDCVLDRLRAMIIQEDTHYSYESYFPNTSWEEMELQAQLNASWREKICQWSYNVVDHFDLPREVVAISLDLFDRYLATRGNQCSGNMALLASLTTLHIAIKVHSEKNIKVSTLASLSRGQFGAEHIEQMEWRVMNALGWKLHPPTLFAFVSHLLMLFSNDVHHTVRKELFEVAIYMAELSVCDSYFVRFPASTVAMAAIINVMEDLPLSRLSLRCRDDFWSTLSHHVSGFHPTDITAAQDRLRAMFSASSPSNNNTQPSTSTYYEPSNVTHSPTSTTEMQLDDATASIATSSSSSFFKSRPAAAAAVVDPQDGFRYSPSPTASQRIMEPSPMSYSRSSSRINSSPIVMAGNIQ